jgi:hypothetical protein
MGGLAGTPHRGLTRDVAAILEALDAPVRAVTLDTIPSATPGPTAVIEDPDG